MPGEREVVDQLARVSTDRLLALQETLALGLLVTRKWDRALLGAAAGRDSLTSPEAAAFDHFADAELTDFRRNAQRMLAEYQMLHRPRPGWWSGFWQGYASAIAYALTLALAAIVIKLNGSDALTLLRLLFGAN